MSTDLFYNPIGSDFTGKLPMKTVDKLAYLDSIEDLYRYNGEVSVGVYYPVRILPSVSIDTDAEWPIVMPAGTIVSVIPLKDALAYTSADTESGILTSGEIYVSISAIDDSTALSKGINFLYPKEVAGLIVPANGGVAQNDPYTDDCGTNGILTMSGTVAASTDAYTRQANSPIGLVNHSVYADMRYRYLNYDARKSSAGVAVHLDGIITVPYVLIYGGGALNVVQNAVRDAVDAKHQYAWFTGTSEAIAVAKIKPGCFLMSDLFGKFTAFAGSDETQRFAKILETRHRVPWNLDEVIDSIPGSGMKGTDTGGLKARTYNFIQEILKKDVIKSTSYAATKANVKKVLYEALTTDTASVTIRIGLVDIAFGSLR